MSFVYNTDYYDGSLWQLKPGQRAINTYRTKDGIIIGMFQGNRGQFPEIDFKIKILKPGNNERPFPPPHSFWVVDLILKISEFRNDVRNILLYYIDFYRKALPFESASARNKYELQTVQYIIETYAHIEQTHTLSLEYVAIIIELFSLNEKRNEGAYMFRDLLQTILDYTNGKADYIKVMQASQPGFR